MNRYLALLFLSSLPALGSVANIQLTASGSATGSCTGGAVTILTVSQFNDSANWGSGSSQIGPDTVILMCGTFTGTAGQSSLIAILGSGTSGHPIVFTCDAGTNITSPQWAGGGGAPLKLTSQSYVTMNGAGCTIQNTANGSGFSNNAYSTGIWIASASNVIVENFTISNICQHTSITDHDGCSTSGNLPAAIITNGSNITVKGNVITDSAYGVYHNAGTDTGLTISGNTIDRCNQHIAAATSGSGQSLSGVNIFGNSLTNAVNWDDGVTDTFHHNGVFIFQGSGGTITAVNIYNNFIGGDFGVNDTSYIFIDPNGTGTISGVTEFNNLMINGSATNGPGNGFITSLGNSSGAAYNNTIFCNGAGFAAIKMDGSGAILKNNIISTCQTGIYVNAGTSISASDYNVIYNLLAGSSSMFYNGANYATVAAWTTGTGFDVHSVTGNPNLTPSGTLSSGSSAIVTGLNLTSLGITALDSDASGRPRPASGAWDIGAYQFVPGTSVFTGKSTWTGKSSTN